MRVYDHREEIKCRNVSHLAEAYRLTLPKSDKLVSSDNGASAPKKYVRAAPKPHPANSPIVALANAGISGPEIAAQVGVSPRVVQRELEHEALKRQVLPDVTRDVLSLSALGQSKCAI